MAIELGAQNRIFTAKFTRAIGSQEMIDIPATGMSDACEKFKQLYPDAELINIWRKQ